MMRSLWLQMTAPALLSMAYTLVAADEAGGKRTFENHCAECHAAGFGHPGAQRLGGGRGNDTLFSPGARTSTPITYGSLSGAA
jgi:mono/diheme cytochrome c family protein